MPSAGRPWLAAGPASSARGPLARRLFLSWLLAGLAAWGALGAPAWLEGRRPDLSFEAFLDAEAGPGHLAALEEAAQAQDWCAGLRFVTAEEARLEAARDAEVRALLEAYGGNPFLRSFRFTLRRDRLPEWTTARAWLAAQPGVIGVRDPGDEARRVLETERLVLRVTRAAAGVLLAAGLLGAGLAHAGAARALRAELGVYAMLGAGPARVFARGVRAAAVPAVLAAAGVSALLAVASAAAMLGWAGPGLARLPAFPLRAAPWLVAAAFALGLSFGAPAAARALRLERSRVGVPTAGPPAGR